MTETMSPATQDFSQLKLGLSRRYRDGLEAILVGAEVAAVHVNLIQAGTWPPGIWPGMR